MPAGPGIDLIPARELLLGGGEETKRITKKQCEGKKKLNCKDCWRGLSEITRFVMSRAFLNEKKHAGLETFWRIVFLIFARRMAGRWPN